LSKSNDGFVLFSVIWIAGLIAVVASTFAISVHLHVKSEANLAGSMEAELAADGLVRLITFDLGSAPLNNAGGQIPIDGKAVFCEIDSTRRAAVTVQDQGGLVDLNRASLNVLATLVGKTAASASDGLSLAEALADFRDSDSIRFGVTKGGPEDSLIVDGPGMKNAPFQSVDEIEQVIPPTMTDLARLKRMVTVYSRQDGIDPDVAPVELKAILGLDPDGEMVAIPFAVSQHRTFAIDVEVTVGDGSKFRRLAMVSILRDPLRPFAILEWRQGSGPIATATGDSLSRSCETFRYAQARSTSFN
jgi:general secretion pathway protein K